MAGTQTFLDVYKEHHDSHMNYLCMLLSDYLVKGKGTRSAGNVHYFKLVDEFSAGMMLGFCSASITFVYQGKNKKPFSVVRQNVANNSRI